MNIQGRFDPVQYANQRMVQVVFIAVVLRLIEEGKGIRLSDWWNDELVDWVWGEKPALVRVLLTSNAIPELDEGSLSDILEVLSTSPTPDSHVLDGQVLRTVGQEDNGPPLYALLPRAEGIVIALGEVDPISFYRLMIGRSRLRHALRGLASTERVALVAELLDEIDA